MTRLTICKLPCPQAVRHMRAWLASHPDRHEGVVFLHRLLFAWQVRSSCTYVWVGQSGHRLLPGRHSNLPTNL